VLSYIAIGLIALYAGLLLMLWQFQERIVFQPPVGRDTSPVAARQVHYCAADGTQLFAFLVGEFTPQGTVVLAFHGNAEVSRWLVPWATRLAHETGACVALAEYRGYDGVPGAPSYTSSAHDARAALTYLIESLRSRRRMSYSLAIHSAARSRPSLPRRSGLAHWSYKHHSRRRGRWPAE
jgi:hypothetical protein